MKSKRLKESRFMRIVAGKYKNTVLEAPSGDTTRPTKDMVKEALFSSIGLFDGEEVFLDLFGGSGAVGFEAVSRGAKTVYINDVSKSACQTIRRNARKFTDDIRISNQDYITFLNTTDGLFDYIFIDPPYRFNEFEKIFGLIAQKGCLKDDGIIIFETAKETVLNEKYDKYILYKEKRYGITRLNYFKRCEA